LEWLIFKYTLSNKCIIDQRTFYNNEGTNPLGMYKNYKHIDTKSQTPKIHEAQTDLTEGKNRFSTRIVGDFNTSFLTI
jgi:hypothetical protein